VSLMPPNITYSLQGKRVWVAGHRGMAGSALVRRLAAMDCDLLTVSRGEVDLRRQSDVEAWMLAMRPQAVFVAAATVGGIMANATRPAEFLYDNLAIETNIIHSAWKIGVEKLLFLGSSCVYPKLAPQPLVESALLTGALEPTNEWYAIAKIAGIKLCQAYRRQYGCDFVSAMPTNLYGPGDNYDLEQGHVIAALQVKVHRAKRSATPAVEVWGSGTPRREFLYVDDLADALVFMMQHYSDEPHLNVGTGIDMTIAELAKLIARIAGYQGELVFDRSKPDGTPRKVLDVTRLKALGWEAPTPIEQGLKQTYEAYASSAAGLQPA
jgi:GDP-L-fucose synthase